MHLVLLAAAISTLRPLTVATLAWGRLHWHHGQISVVAMSARPPIVVAMGTDDALHRG